MPRFLAPSKSGVHRIACLSLYRSLLSQCSRPWLDSEKAKEIRKHLTTRFQNDRALQSLNKIDGSLKAGYEALDLLHSCGRGDSNNLNRLDALLSATRELQAKVARERPAAKQNNENQPYPKTDQTGAAIESTDGQPSWSAQRPVKESILDRPRPHVTGVRRIPSLVNARGVPFLRIKKPQPASLSGVIKGKQRTRDRRLDRKLRLEEMLIVASVEDEWDQSTGQEEKVKWASAVQTALDKVCHEINQSDKRTQRVAEQMWDVVLRERELAEKEMEESGQFRRISGSKTNRI